jgi:Mrp family chromosome partitioning ATPase
MSTLGKRPLKADAAVEEKGEPSSSEGEEEEFEEPSPHPAGEVASAEQPQQTAAGQTEQTVTDVPQQEVTETHQQEVAEPQQQEVADQSLPSVAVVPYFKDSIVCSTGTAQTTLFYRDEVRMAMNRLTAFILSERKVAVVEGSPGVGKSLTTWKWAMDCVVKGNAERVLWHSELLMRLTGVRMVDGELRVEALPAALTKDVLGTVARNSLVILDGATASNFNSNYKYMALAMETRAIRIVLVSSMGVDVPDVWTAAYGCEAINVNPWTLEDHLAATSEPQFLEQYIANINGEQGLVDALRAPEATAAQRENALRNVHELVASKFEIAGSNARWMFEYSTERTLEKVLYNIAKATDTDALFHGIQGSRSNVFVNHLCTNYFDRGQGRPASTEFVSEFATRQLARTCNLSFIKQATSVAEGGNNPSFDGQILEMDVLRTITDRDLPRRLTSAEGPLPNSETYAVQRVRHFRDTDELVNADLLPGTWFIPERFNQGGYDAACYCGNISKTASTRTRARRILRFIQVTRSHRHDLKLQYMLAFLAHLNQGRNNNQRVTTAEVVLMVPHTRMSQFGIPTDVTGSLGDYGFAVAQVKIVGFRRANDPSL